MAHPHLKALLFTEGLADPRVQKEVRQQHPETLADAVRHSRTASDAPGVAHAGLHHVTHTGVGDEYALREVRKTQQQWTTHVQGQRSAQGNWRLPPDERLRLIRENRCFRCKEIGHFARNCNHPNAGRQ